MSLQKTGAFCIINILDIFRANIVLTILSHIKLALLEACIGDIRLWMPKNQLKLNDSKTEFLFLHSKFGDKPNAPTITIRDDCMSSSSTVQNLGVLSDDNRTIRPQSCL